MTATTDILTLSIEARGEIISSNFPAFAEMVRGRLSEINRDLATDEDFDQADADAKAIAGAEAALKAAKEKALADAEQLHALFEQIDELSGDLAKARLDLAKQIKDRKEQVKSEIVDEALATFDIDPRDARRQFFAGLQTAIKGKRTVDSMRTACRIYASTSQEVIRRSRVIIDRFSKAHGPELVMDRRELELKSPDSVDAELRRRWEAKKAADEASRLKAEAEAAKAEADKAKAELAEVGKPPVPPANVEKGPWGNSAPPGALTEQERRGPKIGSIPTGQSPAAEWEAFKATVISAFAPVKAAREGLRHEENQAKAAAFAEALSKAWKEATK